MKLGNVCELFGIDSVSCSNLGVDVEKSAIDRRMLITAGVNVYVSLREAHFVPVTLVGEEVNVPVSIKKEQLSMRILGTCTWEI